MGSIFDEVLNSIELQTELLHSRLLRGHMGIKGNACGINVVTNKKTVTINLEKSKTERYYQHAKLQFELRKSNDWVPFKSYYTDDTEYLLDAVNHHDEVYNLVFKYLYDRCLEGCNEKTLLVEIGRKHQPVSTDTIATEPFPTDNIWAYAHVPEVLRNKLSSWVNSSFWITFSDHYERIIVHSKDKGTFKTLCFDETKPIAGFQTRFDWDSRWLLEQMFANGPRATDTNFTMRCYVGIGACGIHPEVFMPDYFTSIKPRPWTGEMIKVFSSSGDSSYCYLAALKCSSPVLEAQLRWNIPKNIPLTLELSTEVLQALIEFINDSHITTATKSFKLAVELFFAANKYDLKELQDKLLDLIYVQPLRWFDDTEALVELYLLIEVTRVSECVFKRIEGIIKLQASTILSSPIFQDLNPTHKSSIQSLINSYSVVLDTISLWSDNKHDTSIPIDYEEQEADHAENTRIQAIHKRKPWQLCCDYLNYCNFNAGSDAPKGEKPEELIKIVKERGTVNPFFRRVTLVKENA